MTLDNLRRNLTDFYAGNSTPEQEEALRQYFALADNVAEEFQADAALFRAMDSAAGAPCGLKERILNATVRRPRRSRYLWFSSIAAAAAVALMVITAPPERQSAYREVNDPAEAEAITIQIAQTLQHSVNKLNKLNKLPL